MRYDAVIIGSGAGGGPLALRLSEAGLSVLVLEKGPRLNGSDYDHDEAAIESGLFTPDIKTDPHTVVTKKTTRPVRSTLGWVASCLGGGTEHMGAYLYRFHPVDFKMRSHFGEIDALADWPIAYNELEPYYSEAEWEMGVAGKAGANPFEGFRSKPYVMEPLDAHSIATDFEALCDSRGLTAFPTPRAVNPHAYLGRPICDYCESCAGYGCPVGARGTSQSALLSRAEATGNCQIETHAMVHTIVTDRQNTARGCVYWNHEGKEIEIEASLVCVCCSAVESARLLLLSKNPQFPDGLANSNGLVGRNLQFHAVTMGQGNFQRHTAPKSIFGDQRPFFGRSVMDYYFLPEGVSSLNKGGVLRFGFVPRMPLATERKVRSQSGRHLENPDLQQAIELNLQNERSIYFEAFHDFLPTPDTYVSLDPEVKDKWGLPSAQISLGLHPHHKIAGKWLGEKAASLMDGLGARDISFSSIGGTSSYLVMGTCRFGDHADTSVLDINCKTHEVENLYVVDGSFMPSSGGGPPTLTILANSFRVADHLVRRANSGDFS